VSVSLIKVPVKDSMTDWSPSNRHRAGVWTHQMESLVLRMSGEPSSLKMRSVFRLPVLS